MLDQVTHVHGHAEQGEPSSVFAGEPLISS